MMWQNEMHIGRRCQGVTVFLAGIILILVAACSPKPGLDASAGVTLTDGLGREVKLEHTAQRIVSLAPSNTEILFAIGAGSRVVGRDDFSNYPEEALELPAVGWLTGSPNLEQISALDPDLVLVSELTAAEQVDSLANIGLTVFYLENPNDLEGLYSNLETVALLTGRQEASYDMTVSLKGEGAGSGICAGRRANDSAGLL